MECWVGLPHGKKFHRSGAMSVQIPLLVTIYIY